MTTTTLDEKYWTNRYEKGETGWDLKSPSPALMDFMLQNVSKESKVLIPGAGRAWEAEALWKSGYKHIHVLEFAEPAKTDFFLRVPDFPAAQWHRADFFRHEGQYDVILEQTFFCALQPSLRESYARHMHGLLKPGGVLAGLLFDDPLLQGNPPFGGTEKEYRQLFEKYFQIEEMATCQNSIPPRAGREVFMVLRKESLRHN